jgi:hypothetical protein
MAALGPGVFTQPGSKSEKLNASICFPLCPPKRTSCNVVGMSVSCCQEQTYEVPVAFGLHESRYPLYEHAMCFRSQC